MSQAAEANAGRARGAAALSLRTASVSLTRPSQERRNLKALVSNRPREHSMLATRFDGLLADAYCG